jgi:mRNA interferase HigB
VNIFLDILFALCEQWRVRVISHKAIRDFVQMHPDSKMALNSWHALAKQASWKNLPEIKGDFPSADLVGRRTVFNIKGNTYRLIARVNHKSKKVYILYILTHAEYDKGDWKK